MAEIEDIINQNQKIVFLDVETTGSNLRTDRIIEVGAVVFDHGAVQTVFSTLVHPQRDIPIDIQRFTGITEEMVVNAPTFPEIAPMLLEVLSGSVFVAHNAPFDYGFIRAELRRIETLYRAPQLCTVRLSRALYPDHSEHNLDAVMSRLDIKANRRHRALDDAQVLVGFYQKIIQLFPYQILEASLSRILKQPLLCPDQIENQIEDLLPTIGTFVLYGEGGSPLYVGKSTNIKDALRDFFKNDITSRTREIALQTQSLQTFHSAGELGASLQHARLNRTLKPMHTKSQKQASFFDEDNESISTDIWPFNGPIIIEEYNSITDQYDRIVIDKWIHLGTIYLQNQKSEIYINTTSDPIIDEYEILFKFIRDKRNQGKIRIAKKNELEELFSKQ